MVEHLKERQKMGRRDRIRVKKEIGLDDVLTKVYELYEEVVAEKERS